MNKNLQIGITLATLAVIIFVVVASIKINPTTPVFYDINFAEICKGIC
jgi:hypothetical protein